MEIFIGNLPAGARLGELRALVGGLAPATRLEARRGRDRRDRDYHYLIVEMPDADHGCRLIHRLDGFEFDGQRLAVRPYVRRRRVSPPWVGPERRVNGG